MHPRQLETGRKVMFAKEQRASRPASKNRDNTTWILSLSLSRSRSLSSLLSYIIQDPLTRE